jgi:hypothetical protein
MRTPRARWLVCAIALSTPLAVSTSSAEKKPRRVSIAECASFDQRDRSDEDGVDFTIASRCEAPLACGIRWTLTCAPGSKRAKKSRGAASFALDNGQAEEVTASASTCGLDSWQIGEITWSCQPAP